jgi:hypothetical protein
MGDSWKNIDYKAEAKTWMEPLNRGETTGMVEIPGNWDVSDVDVSFALFNLLNAILGSTHRDQPSPSLSHPLLQIACPFRFQGPLVHSVARSFLGSPPPC